MISETLVIRTKEIVENNPDIDVMDALKQAIEEENKFIAEMIEQKTERSICAKKQICKNVFAIANIL